MALHWFEYSPAICQLRLHVKAPKSNSTFHAALEMQCRMRLRTVALPRLLPMAFSMLNFILVPPAVGTVLGH